MTKRKCSVEGCDREYSAKGFCQMHYHRVRRGKDLNAPPRGPRTTTCTVEGCDREHVAKGLCTLHYARALRGASLDDPINSGRPERKCAVEGCGRAGRLKGYCSKHFTELTKEQGVVRKEVTCSADRCGSKAAANGLCVHHRLREFTGVDLNSPYVPYAITRGECEKPRDWAVRCIKVTAAFFQTDSPSSRMHRSVYKDLGLLTDVRCTQIFGTWSKAVEAANLTTNEPPRTYTRSWTWDDIEIWLVKFVKEGPTRKSYREYESWARAMRDDGCPSAQTVRNHAAERDMKWSDVIYMIREDYIWSDPD